ncbi:MAG: DNA polymerase III subunit delta [Candidatus Methylomirabilales bacterium]
MPILTLDKAVAEVRRGHPAPVYLLHGDEYLAREGARALVEALVPAADRAMNVEVLSEEAAQAGLAAQLRTVPLFGGTKAVVVHDIRAFVTRPARGNLAKKSYEEWQDGDDLAKAIRLFLQAVAALGEDAAFVERAARGQLSEDERARLLPADEHPDAERWLVEVAVRAAADGVRVPATAGAKVYEDVLEAGIPPGACLVLTADVVDERRALFKKIREMGVVIDCGVRGKGTWDTQMRPEAARARIAEVMKQAGKTVEEVAARRILEQTGFSVRALDSELEKLCLYAGARGTITPADVDAVLVNSREANTIGLANAVSDKDAARALRAFRSLLAQREPPPRILFALAAEVRSLILGRTVLEARLQGRLDPSLTYPVFQSRILPRLQEPGAAGDGAAVLAQMHPFRAFNLLKAAARFSLPGLLRALDAVHEADLLLKGSGQPEELILEHLVLAICAES